MSERRRPTEGNRHAFTTWHAEPHEPATPSSAIRRLDVFAEDSRRERLDKGYTEDEAKGYGIWLAKVVAARRSGKQSDAADGVRPASRGAKASDEPEPKLRSDDDELQTDEAFDHDIIRTDGRWVLRGRIRPRHHRGAGARGVVRGHPRCYPQALEARKVHLKS